MSHSLLTRIYSVLNDRRQLFWLLQLVGWAGYIFFVLLGAAIWDKADALHIAYALTAALLGFLLTLIMRKSFVQVWHEPPAKRVLLTLFSVCTATAFWTLWKFYEFYQLYHHKESESLLADYFYWYSYSFFILLSWTGLYYGIRFYQEMQAEREKNLRITASAHQSQLKMLRYQLNPHFLFNTLNAISTLIMDGRGEVANSMVSALSKFLRYSLDNDPMQKVSLEQEVGAMQLYLGIEKLRFEERLTLDFRVDEQAAEALIPSMLLQPLIENAIKYAIAKSESGGTIALNAKVFAGNLLLEICDDGEGVELSDGRMPVSSGSGVGLTNTRERLQELYGSNHSYTFSKAEIGGLKVSIRIPFEKEAVQA